MSSNHSQTILIVDDEVTNIQVLNGVFQDEYQLIFATNGHKALELAERDIPDLILLDVMMPELDGWAVCRLLKTNPLTQAIPIMFVTAMRQIQDELKSLELGAVDFITKPFHHAIVKARVQIHMELKRQRDYLQNISSLDSLTGISNRRRFDEFFINEWRRSIRTQTPLSLILMDIDFFKQFNDQYGHVHGDFCLKEVAATLARSLVRPADLVARYGGEEFVFILPDTDYDGLNYLAETLRKNIENLDIEHKQSAVSPVVTVSLGGICGIPSQSVQHLDFIGRADHCLYQAKNSGRNRAVAEQI
ncbi:MAG: diguanylate cyclase [Magnetococcales bacterium]|nr:diguanylate cyclase [Magnetococcales bacterium]